MVQAQNSITTTVYSQLSTTNQSFLDMHYFLRAKGIKNNEFFLVLYDRDLEGVDPRDPSLPQIMKQKVLRECMINYWYFIREVVRIPDQGGTIGSGMRYKLNRANLALNFGFLLNFNMFLEIPRQHGKTIGAIIWYIWVYNFGTTNSEIMFMNKKHDDSKLNLQRMKDIIKALPSYLQMTEVIKDGKRVKSSSNVESMKHPINENKIVTKPGARNKSLANSLGRGCTQPIQWYDEYAFILYNSIIYSSATPAYSTASKNAKRNGRPYGILITTTPGDMTTEEGMDAFNTKEYATKFSEQFYDFNRQQLEEVRNSNDKSPFFYLRFTYQDLGSGEEYFRQMCIDLKQDWNAIRREVLLEWSQASDNSPFTKQDLDLVKSLVMKAPKKQICVCGHYFMNIYKEADIRRYPPIIGVDVSGGYQKDSSAITIIDSKTTEVIADFNCNYISTPDLAKVIYEIVTKYMPNAIVNIERNGGFGASVLHHLIKSKIKRNLYFEIKERVFEERFNGAHIQKLTKKVKVYGFDETKASREGLMEILRDRMDNHKGKFISPIIYDELKTLEVKKNGRIEHANNAHDDQVFSYLLALYVWYEGKNLMENFGLQKGSIYSDEEESSEYSIHEDYETISGEIDRAVTDEENIVESQLNYLKSDRSILYEEWLEQSRKEDEEALKMLLKNKIARKAYMKKYNMSEDEIDDGSLFFTIPNDIFDDIYSDGMNRMENSLQKQFDSIQDIR